MTPRQVHRRFLTLRTVRWLPTGLLLPVLVLLLLDRGLSLAQVGIAVAGQGVMVLLLELPTGGLADTWGRRRVLMAASAFEIASISLLIVADTLPLFILVFALQGVYRALESGPLDSWYVDAAMAADPAADIERGLSHGGVVLGLAIGAGTLLSSALVAVDPLPVVGALVTPLLASLVLRVVDVGMVARLMVEAAPADGGLASGIDLRAIPSVISDAITMVRRSRVLVGLLTVELLWGAGMVAFEVFTPARLGQVLGDADAAASLLGPANAAGWALSAAGAATVGVLVRRIGAPLSGAAMLGIQGLTVVGIGLAAGPVGIVMAYLACLTVHGAANPVHQGMLHRAVTDPTRRATVISANSMTASVGGMVGGIGLGAMADGLTLSIATLAGAILLALAGAVYMVIRPRISTRPEPATSPSVRNTSPVPLRPTVTPPITGEQTTDRAVIETPTDG